MTYLRIAAAMRPFKNWYDVPDAVIMHIKPDNITSLYQHIIRADPDNVQIDYILRTNDPYIQSVWYLQQSTYILLRKEIESELGVTPISANIDWDEGNDTD